MLLSNLPVANNDGGSTLHDQPYSDSVAGNDYDPNGGTLSFSLGGGPGNGSASMNSDGSYTYTPNSGFVGSDSFTYNATNGDGSAEATVFISVYNSVPEPSNDGNSTLHDQSVQDVVASNDGLSPADNDEWTDYEGDPITFILESGASHGSLTLDPNTGRYTYQPAAGYVGNDSFTYRLSDGLATSQNAATVYFSVYNSVPEPSNDGNSTLHDQAVQDVVASNDGLNPLGNDEWADYEGDPITFILEDNVSHGTLTLDPSTGRYTYQPEAGYVGNDSFTYRINDGLITSQTAATVYLSVYNGVPDPSNDSAYTIHGQSVADAVASNDGLNPAANDRWADYEGDPITFVLEDNVQHGSLTFDAATGRYTYQPEAGFSGQDSFTYRLSDGLATSARRATVSINVEGDAPINAVLQVRLGSYWGGLSLSDGDRIATTDDGDMIYQTYVPFEITGSFGSVGGHSHEYKLRIWSLNDPSTIEVYDIQPGQISGQMSVPVGLFDSVGVAAELVDVTMNQIVAESEKEEPVIIIDFSNSLFASSLGIDRSDIKDLVSDGSDELVKIFINFHKKNAPAMAEEFQLPVETINARLDTLQGLLEGEFHQAADAAVDRLFSQTKPAWKIRLGAGNPNKAAFEGFIEQIPGASTRALDSLFPTNQELLESLGDFVDFNVGNPLEIVKDQDFKDYLRTGNGDSIRSALRDVVLVKNLGVAVPLKFSEGLGLPFDGTINLGFEEFTVDSVKRVKVATSFNLTREVKIPNTNFIMKMFKLNGSFGYNFDEHKIETTGTLGIEIMSRN